MALLGLHPNGSRRWPATQGVVDFRPIELPWLRESVKDWARTTRPYLQRLRETVRACRAASQTLTAAGRVDPTQLGAGDFTRITDAMSDLRRADGSVYSASRRTLLLYLLCEGSSNTAGPPVCWPRSPTSSARPAAATGWPTSPTRTNSARPSPTR